MQLVLNEQVRKNFPIFYFSWGAECSPNFFPQGYLAQNSPLVWKIGVKMQILKHSLTAKM